MVYYVVNVCVVFLVVESGIGLDLLFIDVVMFGDLCSLELVWLVCECLL